MKKALLPLMGLAAFAGSAAAQTNVSIYGIVDAGLVRESGGAAGSVTKLGSGISSGSRLGFKGTEDLGGGLAAQFVLESGFNTDTGTSGQGGILYGRQAFVGLNSKNLGAINFGRQYTPLFTAVSAIDPFLGVSMAGSGNNMLSEGGIRMNNTVKYSSPNINGFTSEVAYGFGEVAGDNRAGRNVGLILGYENGPLNIKLAHHRSDNVPSQTVAAADGKTTFLGGTYNFGVAKLALAYAVNKGLVTVNGTQRPDTDSRDALIGVTVPFGPHSIMASYIHKDDRSALNRDSQQLAIGYTYALSKRTNLYTSYGRIKNDAAAGTAGFYTVGNASDAGSGDKAFNVGMRHIF